MIKEKLVKVKTVANYEETIKLLKAYVERSKSVLICSYEEQMDDEMCEIKVVCTRDYANVTMVRNGIFNQRCYCKDFEYNGVFNAEEMQVGMRIKTEKYLFENNILDIFYKVFLNGDFIGDYEYRLEVGEV